MYELREISKMRKVLGLTQVQLAKMAGISQSLLAKIEAGKVDPSYTRARKIFDALDQYAKKQGKKAEDIMVKELITIPYDASVEDAVKIMNEKAVSQLPVVKNGDVVGGITDKVLVSRVASGNSLDTVLKRKVYEVMQEPFPTVSKEAPLDMIAKVLNYYNAVLVYDNGRPAGIITRTDLLKRA